VKSGGTEEEAFSVPHTAPVINAFSLTHLSPTMISTMPCIA